MTNTKQSRTLEVEARRTAGWISRAGKLYPCDDLGHSHIALIITCQRYSSNAGERLLAWKGWARLYYTGQLYIERYGSALSSRQVQLIDQLIAVCDDCNWIQNLQDAVSMYEVQYDTGKQSASRTAIPTAQACYKLL